MTADWYSALYGALENQPKRPTRVKGLYQLHYSKRKYQCWLQVLVADFTTLSTG